MAIYELAVFDPSDPVLDPMWRQVLAPISKGPEKLSSYKSGIEPMGDAWLQFRIHYYMFALVFVVFDVETVVEIGKNTNGESTLLGRH
ncbi:hypothetical protein Ddye_029889 [Dipteronia dyeriana]|uniref:NADH-ubiquinone oxidoreductase chain 3 n=1 Tax=Dipteronia dyeriana TaxID=168575 RepID=A0AAD9TFY5_9ROSI|nr:hypothetical protein Ddye_029889 [Dipteronia dyeriana]